MVCSVARLDASFGTVFLMYAHLIILGSVIVVELLSFGLKAARSLGQRVMFSLYQAYLLF